MRNTEEGTLRQDMEHTKDDAKNMYENAKDRVSDFKKAAKEDYKEAKEDAKNMYENAKDKASDMKDMAKEKYEHAKDRIEHKHETADTTGGSCGCGMKH